jgi:hypothetical protein
VPKLAGPLAIALGGMEADVREAIAERAMQAGAKAAVPDRDGIVFAGSVLIGSGHKAAQLSASVLGGAVVLDHAERE